MFDWAKFLAPPTATDRLHGMNDLGADSERTRRVVEWLLCNLAVAVPIWQSKLAAAGVLTAADRARLTEMEGTETWDADLLFGGPNCADGFDRLAEKLAVLSWLPGGVEFCGWRWDMDQTDSRGEAAGFSPRDIFRHPDPAKLAAGLALLDAACDRAEAEFEGGPVDWENLP